MVLEDKMILNGEPDEVYMHIVFSCAV